MKYKIQRGFRAPTAFGQLPNAAIYEVYQKPFLGSWGHIANCNTKHEAEELVRGLKS